jgi:hypothetical protein
MNTFSTSQPCGTTPERISEDSPPIDSRGSNAGNASPTPASQPGILNPQEVDAPSNNHDDEVGLLPGSHVTGMTNNPLPRVMSSLRATVTLRMEKTQRK